MFILNMSPDWDLLRSQLHELGYRFGAQFTESRRTGCKIEGEDVVRYLIEIYDKAATAALRTVTDHDSALAYVENDRYFVSRFLKLARKLVGECLRSESSTTVSDLIRRVRLYVLERSEHWKAEAHRTVGGLARAKCQREEMLMGIMERQGLNVPMLTLRIRAVLRRKNMARIKADRTTVYRILRGQTKNPRPAIRNAIMEALNLESAEAEALWREFGGTCEAPSFPKAA